MPRWLSSRLALSPRPASENLHYAALPVRVIRSVRSAPRLFQPLNGFSSAPVAVEAMRFVLRQILKEFPGIHPRPREALKRVALLWDEI